MTPQLGRLLTPDDNRTLGGHPVAVISDAFWRRRFNAAADAIGRDITFNGVALHDRRRDAARLRRRVARIAGRCVDSGDDAGRRQVRAELQRRERRHVEAVGAAERPALARCRSRAPIGLTARKRSALNAVFRPLLLQEVDQITDAKERALTLDRRMVLEPFGMGFSNLREQFRAPLLRAARRWSACCC